MKIVASFKDLSSCIEFKKKQITINNNKIKNLHKEEFSMNHTNLNQQELSTGFSDEEKNIKFGCDYIVEREGANYKFAFLSKDFNLWVLESENTKEFK